MLEVTDKAAIKLREHLVSEGLGNVVRVVFSGFD
jgi:hypothetical protein